MPVVVNMLGDTVDEFARLAQVLDGAPGVAGLEVNISCPNLDVGGVAFGRDPAAAARVVEAVVTSTTLPVIAKLTPDVTRHQRRGPSLRGRRRRCALRGQLLCRHEYRRQYAAAEDQSSGRRTDRPAIKPLALRLVWETARAVEIPVIGCGGIVDGRDAVEFLLAGASAVQVGTASFRDPFASIRVLEELIEYCRDNGVMDISELIGAVQVD